MGLDGLAALRYPMDLCSALPQKLCARFCGVGNVQIPAALAEGERVLDIGCGCGTDSLLAALSVGEQGRVTGIDLSPAMIRKARLFAEAAHIGHAEFIAGDITAQTFPPEHFDAVLSNGVFNLIPDKEAALRQIYSLLKRGGRLVIADQVRNAFTSSPLPASDADAPSPASWAQ